MTRLDRRALFASGAAAALLAATGVSASPKRGGRLRAALSRALFWVIVGSFSIPDPGAARRCHSGLYLGLFSGRLWALLAYLIFLPSICVRVHEALDGGLPQEVKVTAR